MKLPIDATIASEKLTNYLLVPKQKNDKSKFLAQGGFTLDNPAALEALGHQDGTYRFIEHPAGGERGAILEVFNALGESIDVVTVPVSAIQSLTGEYIPAVRLFSHSA